MPALLPALVASAILFFVVDRWTKISVGTGGFLSRSWHRQPMLALLAVPYCPAHNPVAVGQVGRQLEVSFPSREDRHKIATISGSIDEIQTEWHWLFFPELGYINNSTEMINTIPFVCAMEKFRCIVYVPKLWDRRPNQIYVFYAAIYVFYAMYSVYSMFSGITQYA